MSLSVFCFCAEWCGTCREFHPEFHRLAQQEASHEFIWLDVETTEHLLGEVEIENFPTIIIANESNVCFFGPILPHVNTLQRLCVAAQAGDLKNIHEASLKSLVKNLQLLQVNISTDGTFRTPP